MPWPDGRGTVSLFPLTDSEVQTAESQAVGLFGLRLAVVARSLRVDPAELGARLFPWELAWLHRQWQDAQRVAWPRLDLLTEWARKSVNDIPDVLADGVAASQAKDVVGYYGKPAAELTRGQLAWFLIVRNAYDEFHGPQAKQATNAWLKTDREERFAWRMNDQEQ